MPTNDELRAMIERLEEDTSGKTAGEIRVFALHDRKDAALMLRSILAEREMDKIVADFIADQKPLDSDFSQILNENLEGLYEK